MPLGRAGMTGIIMQITRMYPLPPSFPSLLPPSSSLVQNADLDSNGGNDKTEDTILDSGMNIFLCLEELTFADKTIALAIDQFASKEGLPAGMDPEMNNLVNEEVNKL